MNLLAFYIFDAAAEAFLPPMFFPTKGMAIRTFADGVNQEDSQFSRHAADYTLFHVGVFHQLSGELEPCAPDSMGNAVQFVVKDPYPQLPLELEA